MLIEQHSQGVLRFGMTILVHSYSKNVLRVLKSAHDRGIRITVITTESQPTNAGKDVQQFCDDFKIPCKTILDSAVGMCMNTVDCIFVGAEAVLENGGIANKIGTFTIALCAKAYSKPLYVFSESLKFLKRFPLQQSDIFTILDEGTDCKSEDSRAEVDYTPPEYIESLFTDIGIFTPAAVSDELISYF